MKIAIIGAGAAGSSAARFLAKAGHSVTVYEQFEVGHTHGSSHGTSRITRKSYPDPYYTGLMSEVFPLWTELEEEAGERLYYETGLLLFGDPTSAYLRDSRASLLANRVHFDTFGQVEVARRFGGFHIHANEEALFQPEAGVLAADRIIAANIAIAKAHGAVVLENTVAAIEDSAVNGHNYDAIIICAGAWTPQLTNLRAEPRLQHFAYFCASVEADIPVWVEAKDDHFYGFPDYGRGFKIGRHMYGTPADPDVVGVDADPQALSLLMEAGRERIGAFEMTESFTCLYTVAPNEDFRIGQIEGGVPKYYVSGCSGHGFKFSVWFGWLVRELIEGRKTINDYPRFLQDT